MEAAKTFLKLPGIEIVTDRPRHDTVLMALGGRAPAEEWLRAAGCRELWAVDRGIEICRRAGRIPDLMIGDADSCSPASLEWALAEGVPFERFESDKDLTDFQLALDIFARKNKNIKKNIILTGAFGGRFDHLWSLIISFLNYTGEQVPFCIADDKEGVLLLHGPQSAALKFVSAPKAVSLIPFSPECSEVSISGVRWPLDKVLLKYAEPYSISNRTEGGSGGEARVSLSAGTLGAYWIFNEDDPDISAH